MSIHADIETGPRHQDLTFRAVEPVDIRVSHLSVTYEATPSPILSLVKKSSSNIPRKRILNDVSAHMPAGSLTAIIGSSGSGKTSLLNTVSRRVTSKTLKVAGSTTFNGNEALESVRSAYVMQQDVLIPSLTVRETLRYAADLRLPAPATKGERREIVERVILELGLKECAETRIGNSAHKGCSGGEKRRTSIGVQMLANPSVLFLDEPTTGLDAHSAYQVVRTLKRLAENGRTVVVSIHGPRSEIWGLFDRVILLARGSVLYSGTTEASLPHFADAGYELPAFENPAEFLIDLAAIDNRSEDAEKKSLVRVDRLRELWTARSSSGSEKNGDVSPAAAEKTSSDLPKQSVGLMRQIKILTARTFKMTIRDPMGAAGILFEVIGMSVVSGWIFLQLGEDQTGIRSREGSMYIAASLQVYLILLYETFRLTDEIKLFDRERNEGVVSVTAFMISRRLARIPLEDVPVPILFSLIYYFMVGYRVEAAQFFIFLAITVISHYIAVGLATISVAVSRDYANASLVGNLASTLQSMACGYFVQVQQMPVYVRWLKWITFQFYAFGAYSANEFLGIHPGKYGRFYDCPYSDDPSDPACTQYTGRYIMNALGLPTNNWILRPILVLMGYAVALNFGAGLIYRYWRVDIKVAQARKGDEDPFTGKEKLAIHSAGEVPPVEIALDKYTLGVEKRDSRAHVVHKTILNPVSTVFEAGKINVIMGPSGSGKTSLLQGLAQRLSNNGTTKYRQSGAITFNGAIPSTSVVRSVSSFVTQDDDALMPALTVRESLRYAAGLRLPHTMSKADKFQRAEEVLMKCGLKDCADNIIGNDLRKGISGGEKRRVTIAIQILTDPKVLLLDEPTSGLDAFTATSIIDVLCALAAEGRTLIMTIHQARTDVFQHFHNVLLLARGGSLAYSGPGSKMLEHFSRLGHDCPVTTNPADFVLDLITVDLQEEDREAESRERVTNLITTWSESHQVKVARDDAEIATPEQLGSLKRQMNPFRITFPLVLRRSFINMSRQPEVLSARLFQVMGLAGILAVFFAPLKHDYNSIQSRMGYIQQFSTLYFIGMLQNLAIYPTERDVFYREELDGCYSTETFIISYTLLELPFTIVSSIMFGAVATYGAGLDRSIDVLFIGSFVAACLVTCGESLGIMFCTVFQHIGFSVNVTSVILSIGIMMGGVLSLNVPGFLEAFNYLSPVKYAFRVMANYCLPGQQIHCLPDQLVNGVCPITSGEQVLKLYNLDSNPRMNILWLAIAMVIYRVLAYGFLKARGWHVELPALFRGKKQNETGKVKDQEKMAERGSVVSAEGTRKE